MALSNITKICCSVYPEIGNRQECLRKCRITCKFCRLASYCSHRCMNRAEEDNHGIYCKNTVIIKSSLVNQIAFMEERVRYRWDKGLEISPLIKIYIIGLDASPLEYIVNKYSDKQPKKKTQRRAQSEMLADIVDNISKEEEKFPFCIFLVYRDEFEILEPIRYGEEVVSD